MAGKYDIESILTELESLLRSQLNTFIGALNTEKNDSIVLATVDFNRADTLHLQSLSGGVIAADPFILFGVASDVEIEGTGSHAAQRVPVEIVLVLADAGNDPHIAKRLYRYQRAIQDLVLQNWDRLGSGSRMKLVGRQPSASFSLFNDDNSYRAVGVSFQITVA